MEASKEEQTAPLLPEDYHCGDNYGDEIHSNIVCQKLSVDEMLKQWVGEFGWAQLIHFTLVSLAWSLEAFQTFVMIFADKSPSWRCHTTLSSPDSSFSLPHAAHPHLSMFPSIPGAENPVCTSSSSLCYLNRSQWDWV
eukprot:c20150_g1_i1 orf=291-704(+)